ncbi:MAG: hypothetical protein V9E88_01875 [Ferruginibacter sp.]
MPTWIYSAKASRSPCLREMMQYQMNSLKCAFMKIKLVLSSRNEYAARIRIV